MTCLFQVQTLSKEGLLPHFLGANFSKTDTPFFGCAFIGACTAVFATLWDVTNLLLLSATAKVTLDILVCVASLATRYGVGSTNLKDKKKTSKSVANRDKKNRTTSTICSSRPSISQNGYSSTARSNLGGCGFQVKREKRRLRKRANHAEVADIYPARKGRSWVEAVTSKVTPCKNSFKNVFCSYTKVKKCDKIDANNDQVNELYITNNTNTPSGARSFSLLKDFENAMKDNPHHVACAETDLDIQPTEDIVVVNHDLYGKEVINISRSKAKMNVICR